MWNKDLNKFFTVYVCCHANSLPDTSGIQQTTTGEVQYFPLSSLNCRFVTLKKWLTSKMCMFSICPIELVLFFNRLCVFIGNKLKIKHLKFPCILGAHRGAQTADKEADVISKCLETRLTWKRVSKFRTTLWTWPLIYHTWSLRPVLDVEQMWEWRTQNKMVKHIMGILFILEHLDVECWTTVWLENSEQGGEVYQEDFVYLEQTCAHLNQSFWKLRTGRWSISWGLCFVLEQSCTCLNGDFVLFWSKVVPVLMGTLFCFGAKLYLS